MSKDWSTFHTEVKQHAKPRGPQCRIRLLLAELPDDAREAVLKVLDNPGASNTAIAKALRERLGEEAPSMFTVGNHRRGNCRCSDVDRYGAAR